MAPYLTSLIFMKRWVQNMGSEDLHHKRKAKRASDLKRKRAKKNLYNRILIVCEGTATEVNYFRELIRHLRLSTVGVEVTSSPATCPMINLTFAEERRSSGEWDTVFCVFDKDRHTRYVEALERSKNSARGVELAQSVPCFEFWILLHYTMTTKSFYGHPRLSPAMGVISELKKFIPSYKKADKDIFKVILPSLNTAMTRAAEVNAIAKNNNTDDPSTQVPKVILALQELRRKIDL